MVLKLRPHLDRYTQGSSGLVLVVAVLALPLAAQQPIGSVKTEQADVVGLVSVSNERALIQNNGTVTAKDHAADVTLTRGGTVRVCATSVLHLSQSNGSGGDVPPLMVALNRGAVEMKWKAGVGDVILTPDLRFDLSNSAPLDVHLRVTSSGDTCVENLGKNAPVLHVTEQFGVGGYFVKPGQHVLFEHGSVREVVDRESSPCGCPSANGRVLAGKGKDGDGKVTKAAKEHPFPDAVSQGLAKPEVPQAPVGQDHVQVATTLRYDGTTGTASSPTIGGETGGASSPSAAAAPVGTGAPGVKTDAAVVSATPPPAGPNPFKAVGRFFKRLFGGG